jgi:YD repeat-containing protein
VDKNNQTSIISCCNTNVTYTFTERDQFASLKNKNGTFWLYNYDGAGQLTNFLTTNSLGATIKSFDYTYDSNGNRISEKTNSGMAQLTYDRAAS